MLRGAAGVFFTGGDQLRITGMLGGTEPIGHIPPAEFEGIHYQSQEALTMVGGLN